MLFAIFFVAIIFSALLIVRIDEGRRLRIGALTVVVYCILLCLLLVFQSVNQDENSQFMYLGFFNITYGAAKVWINIYVVIALAAFLTYLGASEEE